MAPEPLPWDRKDSFFKERKHHERSSEQQHHHIGGGGGGGGFGGGGGVGGFGGEPSRWREPPHPYHYASSPRWPASSDFRYRPHGYGKQGGRLIYPEENGHGFMPSRPNDKSLDDESCRASGSGKYCRNSRENRGSFGHKDWKGHSWEATPSPSGPGRPNDASDQHRSVDDMHTCNSSNPHSDSANSCDQPLSKDPNEKNGGVNATACSVPRFERENSLGTWKPINKWTRSGSLSSRGSGFSLSSSPKSMGADSGETKVEVQPSNVTLVHLPPAAPAAACEIDTAPPEETNSSKKPRLGWGEGLAKYEKKKVVGVDDSATAKNGMVICSSGREPVNLLSSCLADKSPRIACFSECASPATPSSVGCSSSPAGIEEKQFVKAGNVDHDTNYSIVSPGIMPQNHMDGSSFNLENLDLAPITHLNSAINELLQVNDLSSADPGFVKSTAINKLLVWKGGVMKALETIESEIDKLDGELKLVSAPGSSGPHPAAFSSLVVDCHSKPTDEQDAASDITPGQSSLDPVSPGGNDVHKMQNAMEVDHAEAKDENVNSPGSATSKFVEVLSSGKEFSATQSGCNVDGLLKAEIKESENLEVKCSGSSLNEDKGIEVSATVDGSHLVATGLSAHVNDVNLLHDFEDNLCESILASNREIANRSAEVFNKLLSTNQCFFDISSVTGVSCLENSHLVKERLLKRKSFLRFKERVISLKFRALHQQWKDDVGSPSIRKFRTKAQKKLDVSLCTVSSGHHKYIRRLSSPAGSLSLAPTPETVNFVSKLISDSQVKPFRNTLKMPALILDEREKIASRFISTNGLVEDPLAVETERSMINPWTSEERELFMDKLAACGKDFSKIASFLPHKTTADCVEFYYKNHKSDCFRQTQKPPGFAKKGKAQSTSNYLVSDGKRWNRQSNAASLDILGAASAIAANVEVAMGIQQKCTSKYLLSSSSNCKRLKGDTGVLERSGSLDGGNTDRETAAADVLAGICGSLSSEAMGSCITSAVDPGEVYHEWKYQKVGPASRWPLTPERSQNIDDETCSDESCGEMDRTDWTDEEKSIFVQAVSSYGKDFAMISRCVRTRSRDQCRVFFCKARKCLGLDRICSRSDNTDVVRTDANGVGSDTDDTCVVETASHMCSAKSGVRKEDMPSSDVNLNKEHDVAVAVTIEPGMNRSEASNGAGDLEPNDTEHEPRNISNESLVEEKPAQDLDEDVDMDTSPSSSKSVAVQDKCTLVDPSSTEVEKNPGEANDDPDRSDTQVDGGAVVEVAEHHRAKSKGLVQDIYETGMDVDMNYADPSDASGRDEVMKSKPEVHDSGSHHIAADTGSSSGCSGVSGDHQEAALESDSAPKSCAVPPPQNNYSVTMDMTSQVFDAVKCGNSLGERALPATSIGNTGEGCQASRPGEQHLCRGSFSGSLESSHILKGYPMSVSSAKEVKDNGSCERSGTHQSNLKLDSIFHADRSSICDAYLQKCSMDAKQPTSVSELPSLSRHQSTDNIRNSSSSDVEKPHRNGDVKLFGQILTKPSSQQKATLSVQQNGNIENPHLKMGNTFNVKFTGDQSVNGNSALTMLDHNKFLATENLPVRSYGYWDGNKILNGGFPSLPDSAMLLAKYSAAFNNYALPSSRIEQLPLPEANSGEWSFNGPAFPARDIGSSSSGADYQMYRNNREVQQPFTLDVKQQHELLLSEMQRRNRFDVVSSMQQQARGMVGMNVVGRGGIIVGSQCTGVSDPVAAIKMHYAQAEQFNGQASNIIREDDSWRGKGNVGR